MHAPTRCLLLLAALAPGLCLGAGCGGGDAAPGTDVAAVTTTASAPAHYATAVDLRRDLANGVRQGLYRLAVMSQPPDDASDLGQQLPTGAVERVDCSAASSRPSAAAPWPWRCRVGWRTVGGAARTTRYDVRLLPTGCFAAGAVPRYPDHRDTTIASYSEHPLNAIASVRTGC